MNSTSAATSAGIGMRVLWWGMSPVFQVAHKMANGGRSAEGPFRPDHFDQASHGGAVPAPAVAEFFHHSQPPAALGVGRDGQLDRGPRAGVGHGDQYTAG